jgi:Arc/MetJ family transcription regulator
MHTETSQSYAMKATLDLDEDLLEKAMSLTKLPTKKAVIERALRELLAHAAREELSGMFGSDRAAKTTRRRRPGRARLAKGAGRLAISTTR